MSKNLTNAAVIEFDNEVKHEYQGMAKLRNTVTLRTGVVGESYKFTRMGKGLANQKATQADVTPMDISHARQTATLENWNAPEYTDIFDQAEVNFDERQELAKTIAGGIGRREDQIIIDALNAVTFAATNDQNPDTGRVFDISASRNFDVAVVRSAAQHLNEIEAENNNRHIIVQAGALSEMLDDPEVTGADYVSVKALINGELNTYLGFTWHVIGVRAEGGLPGVTGDEIAFAYHAPAIGLAIGIDMKTSIDWVAQKTSWLVNGMFKAGAIAREPQGIIKIQYDETA
ncbi:MAG: phage capsid protein [Fidelibacterota bacterium]